MSWVTHESLIIGQLLGACAYTVASYRLWLRKVDRLAVGALSIGVMLDVGLAVLGSTSNLGDNEGRGPWHHPLFLAAAVLATLGMLGYMFNLVLIIAIGRQARARAFLRYSQPVIWPAWMIGVALFILNVFVGWF